MSSNKNSVSSSAQVSKRLKIMISCLPVSDQRFQTLLEGVLELVRLASKTNGLAIGGKTGDALSPTEQTGLPNYAFKAISAVETGEVVAIPLARPDADESNDVGFVHSANFLAVRVFRTPQGVYSPVYYEKLGVRAEIEEGDEEATRLVDGVAYKFVI